MLYLINNLLNSNYHVDNPYLGWLKSIAQYISSILNSANYEQNDTNGLKNAIEDEESLIANNKRLIQKNENTISENKQKIEEKQAKLKQVLDNINSESYQEADILKKEIGACQKEVDTAEKNNKLHHQVVQLREEMKKKYTNKLSQYEAQSKQKVDSENHNLTQNKSSIEERPKIDLLKEKVCHYKLVITINHQQINNTQEWLCQQAKKNSTYLLGLFHQATQDAQKIISSIQDRLQQSALELSQQIKQDAEKIIPQMQDKLNQSASELSQRLNQQTKDAAKNWGDLLQRANQEALNTGQKIHERLISEDFCQSFDKSLDKFAEFEADYY